MNRQTVLKITVILLRFLQLLCLMGLGLLIYDVIAFSIDPSHNFVRWEWYMNETLTIAQGDEEYPLQSKLSYYFNWLQIALQLWLMLLIWQNLIRVVGSVASFKTFIKDNAESFIKIRNLVFFIWILDTFHLFQELGAAIQMTWGFNLEILLFALAAHVLALIFKEGKRLADEQNLIV